MGGVIKTKRVKETKIKIPIKMGRWEKKGYLGAWMRIFVIKNGEQAVKKKAGDLSGAAARTCEGK